MRTTAFLIISFVFISLGYSQLILIENISSEQLFTVQKNAQTVIPINDKDALILNGMVVATDLSTRILEKKFDAGADNYFILYPVGNRNVDLLKKHGTILYNAGSYLIFKTPLKLLNTVSLFDSYKIVAVRNRPAARAAQAKPFIHTASGHIDSTIFKILDSVNIDTLWKRIEKLQTLERYTTSAKVTESVDYITNYMKTLDFDTVYKHTYGSGYSPNIVGIKFGKVSPDEIYLLGAHYDSYSAGMPAADDNGSGTAGVMEAARVLLRHDFKRTLRFVLFSGEEMGLDGSAAYAKKAADNNDNILGMINMDMIAWNNVTKVQVFIAFRKSDPAFYNTFCANAVKYIPSITCVDGSSSQWANGSDHVSFWNNGYPNALYLGDDLINKNHPYFHKSTDVVGTSVNSKPTAEMFLKAAVANMAELGQVWSPTLVDHSPENNLAENIRFSFDARTRWINFNFPNTPGTVGIKIYTIKGQPVMQTKSINSSTGSLDLSACAPGVYLITLKSDAVSMSNKLVIH